MTNNRQLRNWVFMLYPDNEKHQAAINYIDILENSLYIKHIAKYDKDNNLINKEHYHCLLKYDSPTWLSSLLKELNLSDEDAHLFHSYKDFVDKKNKPRYKSLDEYIRYWDHMETNKPDKYDIDDFKGGLVKLAKRIINSRENEKYIDFYSLVEFVKKYNIDNYDETRFFTFGDWYKVSIDNGYGKLFFDNWYKMRDILKPYITII